MPNVATKGGDQALRADLTLAVQGPGVVMTIGPSCIVERVMPLAIPLRGRGRCGCVVMKRVFTAAAGGRTAVGRYFRAAREGQNFLLFNLTRAVSWFSAPGFCLPPSSPNGHLAHL